MIRNECVKVTHYGRWIIDKQNDIVIDCYVTNDSRRLLSLRGTARAMGLRGGGSGALIRNLKSKWIESYLSEELRIWLYKMENYEIDRMEGNNGKKFYPFDGELFVDLCKAYVEAQRDGVFDTPSLSGNQSEIADKLLSIMSAFAKVGITALIDEITGFQIDREKDELEKILAKYIRKEYLPWTERFPKEFYIEMFRLKKWKYKGKPKPPYVGKLTNQIVYDVLPESVLDKLKEKNPKIENKNYRRYRHHQFLTEDTGIQHLDKHLLSVTTLMRACDSWEEFEILFTKVFKI